MWTEGYVEVLPVFDAEHCPDPLPADFRACLVYAGGTSAAHAWDQAELDRVAHLPRLPVWVPTPGHDAPLQAADDFIHWLNQHNVPSRNAGSGQPVHVLWDMETGQEPDAHWLNRAADRLAEHGWFNLVYGSTSTLFGQPARDGYIVANPTGAPHMFMHPQVKGTQYAFDVQTAGGKIDESLFAVELVNQLWMP